MIKSGCCYICNKQIYKKPYLNKNYILFCGICAKKESVQDLPEFKKAIADYNEAITKHGKLVL